jgi:hypothetical protein
MPSTTSQVTSHANTITTSSIIPKTFGWFVRRHTISPATIAVAGATTMKTPA